MKVGVFKNVHLWARLKNETEPTDISGADVKCINIHTPFFYLQRTISANICSTLFSCKLGVILQIMGTNIKYICQQSVQTALPTFPYHKHAARCGLHSTHSSYHFAQRRYSNFAEHMFQMRQWKCWVLKILSKKFKKICIQHTTVKFYQQYTVK